MTTAAPQAPPPAPVHRRVEHVMGMPVSLALRGRHSTGASADAAWASVLAVLREADRVFSTYRPDSCINRLDRGDLSLEECPPEVHDVLNLGEQARRESGGAFDVRRPGHDGRPHLDPSGVVKGWAVQQAAHALEALPDTDSCLSAGGDMVCRATAGSPPWRIGIEDPHDPRRVLATVPVHTGAVATSGSAHRGAHVVDARTGRAATGLASVTVLGPDLVWADIDATAAIALGEDALPWLRTRTGRRGFVIRGDGTTETFRGPGG
jgi:FAD:protein FMN transferase